MPYTRVNIVLTPYNNDASDVMIALFGELGFESFEELDNGFNGYIPTESFNIDDIVNFKLPFEGVTFSYSVEEIADQNWNEVWEKNYFQPILIDNQCVVRGPFHPEFPEVPFQIVIEPKMAFGTGHHETTGMMLGFALDYTMTDKVVLDMGCGTGILGILASMRGAKTILGVDIDSWCTDNTIENCTLNNVNKMTVMLGGAECLPKQPTYDIIFANINRNILLADMAAYVACLNSSGMLFLSGFYTTDFDAINGCVVGYGLTYFSQKEQNNWMALSYKKM